MKTCQLIILLFISTMATSQGLNIGFSTGSTLLKLESNYSIGDKIEVGAFYGLGIKSLSPHYIGATGKYQFPKSKTTKGDIGGYVGASAGFMYSPSYEVFVIDGFNSYYETVKAEKKFGGSLFFGYDQYMGRKGRVSSFEEIHLGYMPNVLSYALKGLFGALKGEGDINPSKYAWWGFTLGIRVRLGE